MSREKTFIFIILECLIRYFSRNVYGAFLRVVSGCPGLSDMNPTFFSDPGPDLGSEILIPSLLLEAGLEVNNNCRAIGCAHD